MFSSSSHTAMTRWPPDRKTRIHFLQGSRPVAEEHQGELAQHGVELRASSKGRASAEPSRHAICGVLCLATASTLPGLMSRPVQILDALPFRPPPAPATCAASNIQNIVAGLQSSRTNQVWRPLAAKRAGTKNASYTSAALVLTWPDSASFMSYRSTRVVGTFARRHRCLPSPAA